jgi:hypothetical protein
MRKLFLLALGIGMLELLKRRSEKMGLAPSAVLAGAAEKGLTWFRGAPKDGAGKQAPQDAS